MKFTPLLPKHEDEDDLSSPLYGKRPYIVEGLRVISYRGKMKENAQGELPIWIDDETQEIWLRFDEDQLVLQHGLIKTLLDLQLQLGSEPTVELLEMDVLLEGAIEMLNTLDTGENIADSELR